MCAHTYLVNQKDPLTNDGKTYGGSGYSDKLKDSDNNWQVVKESYVVGSGNPNSLAAMSGEVINQMLKEEGLDDFETQAGMEPQPVDEESQYNDTIYSEEKEKEVEEARQKAIEASQKDAGMDIDEKKDHDGDGDIDSDDYMAARDKAIKANMKKKPKKESIETKLAEIGKASEITKMEAQLEFLHDHIDEKIERINSINEDDNLKELVDKKKMKEMQREIKLLEKRKAKMEKVYEKSAGKKFQKQEMVDENE